LAEVNFIIKMPLELTL